METPESKNYREQKIFEHIRYLSSLLEDYIDEIPDYIIRSSPSNYKVRAAWLTAVSTSLESLFLHGFLQDDVLEGQYEAWYQGLQNREKRVVDGEEHLITTREIIDVANNLLKKAIENLQNSI